MQRDRQLEIDFSRAEQLAILREAVFPAGRGRDGRGVSASVLKGVLRAIDDYGGGRQCWPSIATIAAAACCSVRQARRAIEALSGKTSSGGFSVLAIYRQRHPGGRTTGNFYSIVWSELSHLSRRQNAEPPVAPRAGSPVARSDQTNGGPSAGSPDSSTDQPDLVATAATKWPFGPTKWPPGPTKWPRVATKALRSARKEAPPPTPPKTEIEIGSVHWGAAADVLREAGVRFAIAAVREAAEAGLSPADVVDFVATYRANARRLNGPGAIVTRIRHGEWPAEGIVTPEQIAADAAARRRRDTETDRADRHERQDYDRLRRRLELLNAAMGNRLDRMDESELAEIVDRVFDEPFSRQLAIDQAAAGRIEGFTRLALLEHLKSEEVSRYDRS